MRFTSEGLEVGKKVNGSYSGSHTVTKSDGFYIHDASHNDLAHFKSDEVMLNNGSVKLATGSPGITLGGVYKKGFTTINLKPTDIDEATFGGVVIDKDSFNAFATRSDGATQMSIQLSQDRFFLRDCFYATIGMYPKDSYHVYSGPRIYQDDLASNFICTSSLEAYARGGMVTVLVHGSYTLPSSGSVSIGTIPSTLNGRFRPLYGVSSAAHTSGGEAAVVLHVDTAGAIKLIRVGGAAVTSAQNFFGCLTYPTQLNKYD